MSDVCLVLEGTYPYVRGGVSAWVHSVVSAMPDIKFSIISIMPSASDTREEFYTMPDNVQSLINVYIRDYHFRPTLYKKRIQHLFEFFELLYEGLEGRSQEEIERFLLNLMKQREHIDLAYAFSSRDFWESVRKLYERGDNSISFLDFFWNYRFTYLPIVQLLKVNIPPARLYHTISTGYAGIMAVLAKIKYNSNMIVTEHGIYTKERRIEIAQARWIYERETEFVKAKTELGFFKNWWTRYFGTMSRLAYMYADDITTLYNGNKLSQIQDGAEERKISIIPNGVNLAKFKDFDDSDRLHRKRRTIAYIGRIVPIKDIKTLIRSCQIIVQQRPDVQILLIGPQDEETRYYQECSALIKIMGLDKHIVFTGHVDIKEYYPDIDIVLLTSISEAQPLVILEAGACGIPVVATDVGSCSELLEGKDKRDREIGASGIVCKFHAPEQIATAALRLLEDDEAYASMSNATKKRVTKYYDEEDMMMKYRNLYEQYI